MVKKMTAGILLAIFVILLIVVIIGLSASMSLEVEDFAVKGTDQLSHLKIVHLTDLHYPNNGISLSTIISEVNYIAPHIIVLTGDTFDKSATKQDVADLKEFFVKLSTTATTFAVIGNHEIGSEILEDFNMSCQNNGITLLNNEIVYYNYASTRVAIIGLKDAYAYNAKNLPKLSSVAKDTVKILLAHRCEKFDSYVAEENKPDYIFAGHAHGGQMRIFNRGIYSPNQGFLPEYTSGAYKKNDSTMYVSRGLGESQSNLRWFNKYHIIAVEFL